MVRFAQDTVLLKPAIFLVFVFFLLPPSVPGAEQNLTSVEMPLQVQQKWVGDYDGMVKRRLIRVLMPYSKTFYFFDGAVPRGLNYEAVKHFEAHINKQLKTKLLKVHMLMIPTARAKLFAHLNSGLGDIAVGNLTITDDRVKQVDFADPLLSDVDEIPVTGPKSPPITRLFDLAGKEVVVRKSSSYWESLKALNDKLALDGKPPVKIIPADENLEDEDLLEMLNVGLVPMTIIDSHKGHFWSRIFKGIKLHPAIKVRSGGKIAWAIRKNSPKLKKVIDTFVKINKKGTLTGNILFNRYLKKTSYIVNSHQKEDMKRFREKIKFFEKYGDRYRFDHLMLTALAYQESRLDQNARSKVGAVGVMQILPSTASDKNVNIPGIDKVDSNIHAGTKYLRFIQDRYFSGDNAVNELNRVLFTFASYNAGPGKIGRLRKEAGRTGLDPNVWFKNVEVIAAKRIGRENVQYVSNIYKYYISYKLLAHKMLPDDD